MEGLLAEKDVKDVIVVALAAAHRVGCPDGPGCIWCPAEAVMEEFRVRGLIVVQGKVEA